MTDTESIRENHVGSPETIIIARTLAEVRGLRETWERMPISDIDSEIDYYLEVVANSDRVISPYVMHVRRRGLPDLMAVARLEKYAIPLRVGYRVLGQLTRRALVLSFEGILGARKPTDFALVVKHLKHALDKGDADLLIMRHLDTGGDTIKAFTAALPWFRRSHFQTIAKRWITDLPPSFAELLERRSAKTRNTLHRHERSLKAKFGDRLRLRVFSRADEFGWLCQDMRAVSGRSYQSGLGVAFLGAPMESALLRRGLEKGWSRTWMLYIDDLPVAFWTGFGYAGTFFVGTPGFDPDYGKHSVGRVTMLHMFADLCADQHIHRVDYGQGEAEYKAAFGHPSRAECDMLVSAGRPSAILAVLTVSGFDLTNRQARAFVQRSAWGRRLKAQWRRNLQAPPRGQQIRSPDREGIGTE